MATKTTSKQPKTPKQPKIFATTTIAGKRIDLCRVEFSARLSQETNAYAADVWVDGAHFCTAENSGQGGPDHYHPVGDFTQKDLDALDAFLKANVPAEEYHGTMIESDLKHVVGDLISDWQAGKQLDSLLKTNFPFIDQNKVSTFKGKFPPGPARDKARAQLLRESPNAIILADLPRDEALRLFKKHT